MRRRSFLFLPFFHRHYLTWAGIRFRVRRYGHGSRRYLFIHGNEATARKVLEIHMETHPGIAYLITNSERNAPIDGGLFDPNRMFSREGATANLRKLNPDWTPDRMAAAAEFLEHGAQRLVKHLIPPHDGLLVALHNNSEAYSVFDEQPDSDRVSIRQPERPHEFFLATDAGDFEKLAQSPYNVVLQTGKRGSEDGSLSRLAAKQGFRYVNLECAAGQFEAQMERLGWLDRNLT